MSTRSASWSRPAERTEHALLLALAVCALAAAWAVLHLGIYSSYQIRDTPVYRYYGESMPGAAVRKVGDVPELTG